MSSDELFEAVSHPMRIEIIKKLAEKPLFFTDLTRYLKIDSSDLLDFHLKKLDDLITINDEGNYTLTDRGFAALNTIETTSKYYWLRAVHKRSFIFAVIVSILLNISLLWILSKLKRLHALASFCSSSNNSMDAFLWLLDLCQKTNQLSKLGKP